MLPSNHEPFKKKFAKFTERALDWALFARQDLLTRGNETNNYSEITMRLLKEEVCFSIFKFEIIIFTQIRGNSCNNKTTLYIIISN